MRIYNISLAPRAVLQYYRMENSTYNSRQTGPSKKHRAQERPKGFCKIFSLSCRISLTGGKTHSAKVHCYSIERSLSLSFSRVFPIFFPPRAPNHPCKVAARFTLFFLFAECARVCVCRPSVQRWFPVCSPFFSRLQYLCIYIAWSGEMLKIVSWPFGVIWGWERERENLRARVCSDHIKFDFRFTARVARALFY